MYETAQIVLMWLALIIFYPLAVVGAIICGAVIVLLMPFTLAKVFFKKGMEFEPVRYTR